MVRGEDSDSWRFFSDGIEGFDFEPGFIYTLEVRLEDRGTEIQDVGRYAYHLVKIIEKKTAPDDFSYEWSTLCTEAKNEIPTNTSSAVSLCLR